MTDGTMRIRPMGESALLVEVPDARVAVDLYGRLRADTPGWVVELVPAARTVLLVFDRERIGASRAEAWLTAAASSTRGERSALRQEPEPPAAASGATDLRARSDAASSSEPVEILARYDGPDLGEVAALLGIGVDEVIHRHTGQLWTSAFIGFAPGFAYLVGEDEPLTVPRRETPRTAVPAGSIALAAGFCGIYPRASPGGWHLIGTTEVRLWDASRAQPALLAPGTRVRFIHER
ncbi:5-oxoprolinase subunit B family protein [Herbiconiux sp. YIM B11900]|uniref:5-oxoprolinase subunit B family protein n=1 Tax=Herbiconiux sp. YIM B11900 TaxID=3404131 RepID=UPI003F87D148